MRPLRTARDCRGVRFLWRTGERMRLRLTLILIGCLAAFTLLWSMWPSPISPAYWDEPAAPEMTGALEPDGALADAVAIDVGLPGSGEGIAVSDTGTIYYGTADGRVMRLMPNADNETETALEVAQVTETLILGLDWIAPDVLGVAAISGLYALDVETGHYALVSSGAPAHPFGYVNDLAAAPDGRIFFTDSSTRWGHDSDRDRYRHDMLENRPSGALYVWDPATHQTRLVRSRLHYPNGIELAPDGRSVLVAETFRYRIVRIWIDGPEAGSKDIFAENLPGLPDGLATDSRGRLLVTMPSPRVPLLGFLHRHPRITQLLMKVPEWLRPGAVPARAFILVLDTETGEALDSWHDPDGRLGYLSNTVQAPDGDLWIGTTDRGHLVRFSPDRPDTAGDTGAPVSLDD